LFVPSLLTLHVHIPYSCL